MCSIWQPRRYHEDGKKNDNTVDIMRMAKKKTPP